MNPQLQKQIGLGALVGIILAGLVYFYLGGKRTDLEALHAENHNLQAQVDKGKLLKSSYEKLREEVAKAERKKAELEIDRKQYEPYIALEKKFRDKKEGLQKKEEVMTTLKRQQNLPVHFLEELANSLPDDVWFKRVAQKGSLVTIEGEGRNFEAINAFYGNLQSRTRWFKKIAYPGAKRGANGAFEFTISFELQNAV